MDRIPFAEYVASRRKALGKSQKDLADALNYTPQAISRFEALDSSFSLDLLPSLCAFLDCSLDDIFFRKEEGTSYVEPKLIQGEELGKKLAEIRSESGRSQETLAADCFISVRAIHNYESGKAVPSYQILERWALACGKAIDAFSPSTAPIQPLPSAIAHPQSRPRVPRFIWLPVIVFLAIAGISLPFAFSGLWRNQVEERSSIPYGMSSSNAPSTEPSSDSPTSESSTSLASGVLPEIDYVQVYAPAKYTHVCAWYDESTKFDVISKNWPGKAMSAFNDDWNTATFKKFTPQLFVIFSVNGYEQTGFSGYEITGAGHWWYQNGSLTRSNVIPELKPVSTSSTASSSQTTKITYPTQTIPSSYPEGSKETIDAIQAPNRILVSSDTLSKRGDFEHYVSLVVYDMEGKVNLSKFHSSLFHISLLYSIDHCVYEITPLGANHFLLRVQAWGPAKIEISLTFGEIDYGVVGYLYLFNRSKEISVETPGYVASVDYGYVDSEDETDVVIDYQKGASVVFSCHALLGDEEAKAKRDGEPDLPLSFQMNAFRYGAYKGEAPWFGAFHFEPLGNEAYLFTIDEVNDDFDHPREILLVEAKLSCADGTDFYLTPAKIRFW